MDKAQHIWVVGILLSKDTDTGITLSHTLSYYPDVTEDDAKGKAVSFAMKEKKGFAIENIITAKIELSIENDVDSQD